MKLFGFFTATMINGEGLSPLKAAFWEQDYFYDKKFVKNRLSGRLPFIFNYYFGS